MRLHFIWRHTWISVQSYMGVKPQVVKVPDKSWMLLQLHELAGKNHFTLQMTQSALAGTSQE